MHEVTLYYWEFIYIYYYYLLYLYNFLFIFISSTHFYMIGITKMYINLLRKNLNNCFMFTNTFITDHVIELLLHGRIVI